MKHQIMHKSPRPIEGFASKMTRAHYPPNLCIEPTHLEIKLALDIDAERAAGTVGISVVCRASGSQELTLDAVGFEDVSVADTSGAAITWIYDGDEILIRWHEALVKGDERTLDVTYVVQSPVSGLFFTHPSKSSPDAGYWAATDHETERARYWLPTIDHPAVRTTLGFSLRAREDLTILANGSLESEESHDDGTKTARWVLDFPCPSYLVCLAIGDFARFDDAEFEGRPISYFGAHYVNPEDLQRSFGRTGEMMEWMTKRLGVEFPFDKYFQFALPGIGGAMENISLVSWEEIFVLDPKLATEWTWLLDQINVHEMGHAYFGDAVVCRDFAHVWLKESWATYIETCWLEDKRGEDEWKYDFFRNAHAYFSEADDNYSRPLVTRFFDSSWDMFDRHLYPGGACRLHTLRSLLGDEVFWPAVTDYLETFKGKVVETNDFRKVMEKHSGRSLGQFFDQWFETAGYPDLKVGWSWDAEQKQGTFTIEQKQAKDNANTAFEFELDLAWWCEGTSETRTVSISRATHDFVISPKSAPEMVRVDPDCKVLHKIEFNPGVELLKKQLRDGDVIGRILAGRELCKTGKRTQLLALSESYASEPFWGVRQQWAKSIAAAKTQWALDALAGIVAEEQDPMVLESVITSCSKIRDEGLRDALVARAQAPDFPYWASANAWLALGEMRVMAPTELLVEAARTPGLHGITQAAALRGLAASRCEQALDSCIDVLKHGTGTRVRSAAAAGVAEVGKVGTPRVREICGETLIDGLRDPDPKVGEAAAAGLVAMSMASARSDIEAFANTRPQQDKVSILRTLKGLLSQDKKLAELQTSLDDVQKLYRELELRLGKIEDKSIK